jgi:hypothetical protein
VNRKEQVKTMNQDEVSAWLGIDWADQKHRWAMRIDDTARHPAGFDSALTVLD